MKWSVDAEAFRPTLLAIQCDKTGNPIDTCEDDNWREYMLRIEAKDGQVTLRGPYGEAIASARVDRPGVMFVPLWEFVQNLEFPTEDETIHEIELIDDDIWSNHGRFMFDTRYAVFDDPSDAPETADEIDWTEEEDEEDDWFGTEDADDGDPKAEAIRETGEGDE